MAILSGLLKNPQGLPVTAPFNITLFDFGVHQAENTVYLGHTWTVTPDINGSFTVELWNNLQADNSAKYLVEHPEGITYQLKIPASIETGNFTDYITDIEVDTPGVLARLSALESSGGGGGGVDSSRVTALELSQAGQDVLLQELDSGKASLDSFNQLAGEVVDLRLEVEDTSLNLATHTHSGLVWGVSQIPDLPISQITGLQDSLDSKLSIGYAPSWNSLTDIPSQWDLSRIPPLPASGIASGVLSIDRLPDLPISQIIGLQDSLDSKLSIGYAPSWNSLTDVPSQWDLSRIPPLPASSIASGVVNIDRLPDLPISQIIGLQDSLNIKSPVGHTHGWGDLPNSNPPLTSPVTISGSSSAQLNMVQTASGLPDYRWHCADRVVSLQADDNSDGVFEDTGVFNLNRNTGVAQVLNNTIWHSGNLVQQSGSFSPYPRGSGWGYTSSGSFKRVGDIVLIRFTLNITTVGTNPGPEIFQVMGFPYSANGVTFCTGRFRTLTGLADSYNQLFYIIGDIFQPQMVSGSNAIATNYALSRITSSTELMAAAVYHI